MPEPNSSAIGGVALATGAITLSGSIFGLQADALLFGLFGGLVSLMHLEPTTKLRMAGTLATAALLGAIAAPVMVAAELEYFDWLASVPGDILRLGSAFLVGLGAQVLIPAALAILAARGRKAEGQP